MWYARNRKTGEHVKVAHALDGDQEWDYVEADTDGWIPWEGGECPLPNGQHYQTRHASGDLFEGDRPETFGNHWRGKYCDKVIAYRPILDEKPRRESSTPVMDDYRDTQETKTMEWNGEGLPPVGAVCECTFAVENHDTWHEGIVVTKGVMPEGREMFVVDTGEYIAAYRSLDHVRPIRTAAQRAEDEAVEAMHDYIAGSKAQAFAIYYAIREGRIPGVKLED